MVFPEESIVGSVWGTMLIENGAWVTVPSEVPFTEKETEERFSVLETEMVSGVLAGTVAPETGSLIKKFEVEPEGICVVPESP